MADTRQITPAGPGTIGGRTHSRKRAAQRRGRDLPGHDDRLLSRHTSERGVEAGQTEAGERPAPFVCRDVACVYRTEAATRAAARRRDPELREERAPMTRVGFKREQVTTGGQPCDILPRMAAARRQGVGEGGPHRLTGTSLLIVGGGVSWDYPPGSPLS